MSDKKKYIVNPKLTDDQLKAVYAKGDVIVSAAAGSGKTTTMIECIMDKVVNNDVLLKNMLILVYNNAAADELRDRLYRALFDVVKNDNENDALRTQIDELPLCHISTIHAYCQSLIKENFALLGVSPKFEVIDEMAHAEYMNKALDNVFAEYMKEGDEEASFFNLSRVFSEKRNEESFKNIIVELFKAKDIQSDKKAFEDKIIKPYADFDHSEFLAIIFGYYQKLFSAAYLGTNDRVNSIFAPYIAFFSENDKPKYTAKLQEIDRVVYALANSADFFDMIKKAEQLDESKTGIRNDDKDVKEKYKEIATECDFFVDAIKALKGYSANLDTLRVAHDNNKAYIAKLLEISDRFGEELNRLKEKDNVLAFEDLQHKAVELFNNPDFETPKYDAVFIDEYQDVNPTQEGLIRAIDKANPGKCFMVGDVKQSIYGFRLANPQIFLDREEEYRQNGKNALSFNENFRSAKEILEFVNLIFDQIMTKSVADVDYKNAGRFDTQKNNMTGGVVEVHIFAEESKKEAEAISDDSNNDTTSNDEDVYDIRNAPLKETEQKSKDCEAIFVVQKIKELVDGAKISGRRLAYDDIVILARNRNNLSTISKYLRQERIPFDDLDGGKKDDSGFEDDLLCFLKSIDNPRQDIPFVGFLLSFFGGFNEQELATIAKRAGDCYYDKFFIFSKLNPKDAEESALVAKVNLAISTLEKYRVKASFKSVKELIGGIIADFSYDAYLSRNGDSRIYAVRSFVSAISDKDNESLSRFLRQYNTEIKSDTQKSAPSVPRKAPTEFLREIIDALSLMEDSYVGKDVIAERFATYRIGGALKDLHSLKALSVADIIWAFIKRFGDMFDEKEVAETRLFIDTIPVGITTVEEFLEWYYAKTGRVRLSTMHGYKGLESEAVFVVGLNSSFNTQDYSGNIAIDSNGSVAIDDFDFDNYWKSDFTISKIATTFLLKQRMIKEEMRLMYVALTRAKRYMYLTATVGSGERDKFGKHSMETPKKMLDFISEAVASDTRLREYFPQFAKGGTINDSFYYTKVSEFFKDDVYKRYDKKASGAVGTETTPAEVNYFGAEDADIVSVIKSAQDFVYENKPSTSIAVKYSVSAIDKLNEDSEPAFSEEGANVGTIYHKIMQYIDFNTTDVQEEIDKLLQDQVIDKSDVELLQEIDKDGKYLAKIRNCLNSEIIKIARDGKCLREKSFLMYKPASEVIDDAKTQDEVLVQGIIDLMIFKDDEIIIVDFKNSRLKDEKLLKQYKKQLNLYKMAVEAAFGAKTVKTALYSFATGETKWID